VPFSALPILLSEEWLQCVYTTFNEFQTWYGSLERYHLPQYKATGQIRLERRMPAWRALVYRMTGGMRFLGRRSSRALHPDDDLETAAGHQATRRLVMLTPFWLQQGHMHEFLPVCLLEHPEQRPHVMPCGRVSAGASSCGITRPQHPRLAAAASGSLRCLR
jgi:hypothetical protein